MKQEVKNHLLGATFIFAFIMTMIFLISLLFKVDLASYTIIFYLIVLLSAIAGEKLLKRFFSHLIRGFKEAKVELFIFIVIITFIDSLLIEATSYLLVNDYSLLLNIHDCVRII